MAGLITTSDRKAQPLTRFTLWKKNNMNRVCISTQLKKPPEAVFIRFRRLVVYIF